MGHLSVGWGQKDITPRGGGVIIAGMVPLRVTDVIHDPMHALAMVEQSAWGRTIWVGCDFCHPSARVRREVSDMLRERLAGFSVEQLILNGTHATACFYLTDDEFLSLAAQSADSKEIMPLEETRKQVCEGIAAAVRDACAHLEETVIERASAQILTGYCRRVPYQDQTAEMYGDVHRFDFWRLEYPDGGAVQLLYFYRANDHALRGIFANVPCPAQANDSSAYITADYWGAVRERVCQALGNEVRVLGTCRAAGELSPHRMLLSPDRARADEWGRGAVIAGDAARAVCFVLHQGESLRFGRIKSRGAIPLPYQSGTRPARRDTGTRRVRLRIERSMKRPSKTRGNTPPVRAIPKWNTGRLLKAALAKRIATVHRFTQSGRNS